VKVLVHGKCHSSSYAAKQLMPNKFNDMRELHFWKPSHRMRRRSRWMQSESVKTVCVNRQATKRGCQEERDGREQLWEKRAAIKVLL
jgi:hypothetical protein